MFASSADSYTIRQMAIQRAEFLQVQHSKIYLMIGPVRHAGSEKNILRCGQIKGRTFLFEDHPAIFKGISYKPDHIQDFPLSLPLS